MNALVEKKPFIETAQATEFPRRRAGIDTVRPQVLKKTADILFRGSQEGSIALFEELGKGAQIALVGLAGERTKALFYAQIYLVFLQKSEIVPGAHLLIIGLEQDVPRNARNGRTSFITESRPAIQT
jgi:hypothetical protein